jgi:Copper amine oxidase, enzyme domain
VVSFHVTVANYEYLVYWRFYQDGNIECEVRATGIVVTSLFPNGRGWPGYGTLVDERIYAPFHQHFIVARLDLDVDGPDNTVYATESVTPGPGGDDPYGLGLVLRETPLRTEAEGKQDYDWSAQRGWKVVNDSVRNELGTPVGYKLVPSGAFPPLLDRSSPAFRRAEVIGHTLWVTPYREDERWPCGDFPNLGEQDTGLPAWTARNRSIENTDVVLWYVFGIHHITRPEDWPVMPVDIVSFWLKPFGFFARWIPRQTSTGPAGPGMTQNWLRHQPPGSTSSLSVCAKASRTPGSGARTSASQAAGTTARPAAVPSSSSICPNLARSRAVAEIPPSWTADPRGSQVISASHSAPIGCQMRAETRSAMRLPQAPPVMPIAYVK